MIFFQMRADVAVSQGGFMSGWEQTRTYAHTELHDVMSLFHQSTSTHYVKGPVLEGRF